MRLTVKNTFFSVDSGDEDEELVTVPRTRASSDPGNFDFASPRSDSAAAAGPASGIKGFRPLTPEGDFSHLMAKEVDTASPKMSSRRKAARASASSPPQAYDCSDDVDTDQEETPKRGGLECYSFLRDEPEDEDVMCSSPSRCCGELSGESNGPDDDEQPWCPLSPGPVGLKEIQLKQPERRPSAHAERRRNAQASSAHQQQGESQTQVAKTRRFRLRNSALKKNPHESAQQPASQHQQACEPEAEALSPQMTAGSHAQMQRQDHPMSQQHYTQQQQQQQQQLFLSQAQLPPHLQQQLHTHQLLQQQIDHLQECLRQAQITPQMQDRKQKSQPDVGQRMQQLQQLQQLQRQMQQQLRQQIQQVQHQEQQKRLQQQRNQQQQQFQQPHGLRLMHQQEVQSQRQQPPAQAQQQRRGDRHVGKEQRQSAQLLPLSDMLQSHVQQQQLQQSVQQPAGWLMSGQGLPAGPVMCFAVPVASGSTDQHGMETHSQSGGGGAGSHRSEDQQTQHPDFHSGEGHCDAASSGDVRGLRFHEQARMCEEPRQASGSGHVQHRRVPESSDAGGRAKLDGTSASRGSVSAEMAGVARARDDADERLPKGHENERLSSAPLRTTVMLRNVPNNYNREMLLALLDEEGFNCLYDFVYLPIDFSTQACLGYAFVNLISPEVAQRFWESFDGFTRWVIPSKKSCTMDWSHPHQGLASNIERYRNSPVMHEDVPNEYKPVLFEGGTRVPFPAPTQKLRMPRIRGLQQQRAGARADSKEEEHSTHLGAGQALSLRRLRKKQGRAANVPPSGGS